MKVDLRQNGVRILSIVALVAMFLPMLTIEASMNFYGVGGSHSNSVNGLDMIRQDSILWVLLLLGPVALLASSKVEMLKTREHVLGVIIPIVCLLFAVQALFFYGSFDVKTGMMDTETSIGIGGILTMVSYAGILFLNAKKFGYTFDKDGAKKLKENSADAMKR